MDAVERLFVAVGLDDEARHRLAHDLGDPMAFPGRPVHPDNWHITLRFLGDVAETARDRLLAGLDQAALGAPFTMAWDALGAFPSPRKASVLWVGVGRGSHRLTALAERVREVCDEEGFGVEDRPFRPHLTVSRMRPPVDVRPILSHGPVPGGAVRVDDVVVFRSHLGSGGARYEMVERIAL